ncbi:hypothetical protein ACFFGH_26635 [Lysobacter korlensis]|uniref:CHAT domain-containing protein n=1 Tax=Lysobacter korlensis TaxID=553636 RepID=A0ABV6RWR7_9GAMM
MATRDEFVSRALREAELAFDLRTAIRDAQEALGGGSVVNAETVEIVGSTLRDRIRSVESGLATLNRVVIRLDHLAHVLPFTEEGWPTVRASLRVRLDDDPSVGVAEWARYALDAASRMRTSAVKRLLTEVPLRMGTPLSLRVSAMADALEDAQVVGQEARSFYTAQALLEPAMAGLVLGGVAVPEAHVRRDLQALLVRLALNAGRVEDAARLLDSSVDADEDSGDARRLALNGLVAAANGDGRRAERLLADARSLDSVNLDAAAAVIQLRRRARAAEDEPIAQGRRDADGALAAAREAVGALESLADVDADLRVLLDTPPELWLAVVERAAAEGDTPTCRHALQQLVDAATGIHDGPLRAAGYEALAAVEEDPERRCAALISAGDERSSAKQSRQAAALFHQAMGVRGASDRATALATVRWADEVAILAWELPSKEVAVQLQEAMQRVRKAVIHLDYAGEDSWSFFVVARLDEILARGDDPGRSALKEEALLATARAVAFQPNPGRWEWLGSAAENLNLHRVAFAFFKRSQGEAWATESSPSSEIIQVLVNMGRLDEAIKALEGSQGLWESCARGYALLRTGDARGAATAFESLPIDPTWGWAWTSYTAALMLLGRREDAAAIANRRLVELTDRWDEMVGLEARCDAAFVDGKSVELLRLGERLREIEGNDYGEGQAAVALGLLIAGQAGDALAVWSGMMSRSPEIVDLIAWSTVVRPMFVMLTGTRPPDFSGVDAVVRNRLVEFRGVDEHTELERLRQSQRADAELAADLCAALLTIGSGEEEFDRLLKRPGKWAELETETSSIRAHVQALDRSSRTVALARTAVTAARSGDHEEAERALRSLLDNAPRPVDELLDAPGGLDFIGDVVGALERLRSDAAYRERAHDLLVLLGQSQADEDGVLRLLLPSSWFHGYDDPPAEHEVFRVALPTLRASPLSPPERIIVGTADDLEPDVFVVVGTDGSILDRGSIPLGRRYLTDDVLPLLGPVDPDAVGPGVLPGWRSIQREAFDGDDPTIALLTVSPFEMAVQALGHAVHGMQQNQLKQSVWSVAKDGSKRWLAQVGKGVSAQLKRLFDG